MRFLADENIASQLVKTLRAEQYDVDWIAETAPSVPDEVVIRIAKTGDRILLTADIELASRTLRDPQSKAPTILLRMGNLSPADFAHILAATIKQRDDWKSLHAVLTPQKLRIKVLPGAKS
jgi:predicted nuclease of predicted toxin-antitoxin system